MVKHQIRLKNNLPYSERKLSNGIKIGIKDFVDVPKELWMSLKSRDGGKVKSEFEFKQEK